LMDSSEVVISPNAPTVVSLALSPSELNLEPGGTQKLAVTGKMSDGTTAPVPVSWTASGGEVDTANVYAAGTESGTYRIIAKQLNGALADTSAVTIAATTPPPDGGDTPGGGGTPTGDYYVATSGSDGNPGTSAAPVKTIQKAANVAGPGDTVIVRDGTYTGGSSGGNLVSLSRSGTSAAWITFLAERKWGAVLDGRNNYNQTGVNFGSGVSYVRVEGFEIRGFQGYGFVLYGGGHDLAVVRNHVHTIGRYCTDTHNGRTGVSIGDGTRGVLFEGNVWHDIGRFADGENGCNTNDYYQNHDHGIYVADADAITIRNNVFYNLKRGWAIQRYNTDGYRTSGLAILNNTFAGENPYREGQFILATATSGIRIENN
ncbi:MAG: right-handed parallel beta-helix repeat-containing protein, partial [Stackebrandtia sp.]